MVAKCNQKMFMHQYLTGVSSVLVLSKRKMKSFNGSLDHIAIDFSPLKHHVVFLQKEDSDRKVIIIVGSGPMHGRHVHMLLFIRTARHDRPAAEILGNLRNAITYITFNTTVNTTGIRLQLRWLDCGFTVLVLSKLKK